MLRIKMLYIQWFQKDENEIQAHDLTQRSFDPNFKKAN